MICAGGTNFPEKPMLEGGAKTWTDRVFTLSPKENAWKEAGTLPVPYAYGASASVREGLLCIGGGIYVLVCPERVWKIVLYPRLHQWPDREPFSWELLMTSLVGGALTLFGLLACFGYL